MFGINGDVIAGMVRHVFTTFGGVLVTKGVVSADELTAIGGAIATLVGFVWSYVSKKKAVAA